LFNFQNAYSYERFTSLLREYITVLKVTSLGIFIAIALLFLARFEYTSRTLVVVLFLVTLSLFVVEKTMLFGVANRVRRNGKNRKRVLLVGTGKLAKSFIEVVDANFKWGIEVVGVLTGSRDKVGRDFCGKRIVDSFENIEGALKAWNPQQVIIAVSTRRFDVIRSLMEVCEQEGVSVHLYSDFLGHVTKNISISSLHGLSIMTFNMVHQSEWGLGLKRFLDIVGSLLALLFLSPLMLAAALGILIADGRPVLYNWNVIGLDRKPIKSWKFRTMVRNADKLKGSLEKENEMTGPVFKIKDDPRVLPFGRWLRKWSIDETPQLFSVLKGDLSLVGPRPVGPHELERYESWHRRKLSIKSGLTCLWQVNGRNGINNFDEWVKLDLEYIDNWSVWLDIKILLKTIPAVLLGKGAS
jgi:exopolysaccharide biosynthesis polyprenyl glycosylphosphotransferase